MKIDLLFTDVNQAYSPAAEVLELARELPTYQSRLDLRHPLAIYGVSLNTVLDKFIKALDSFSRLKPINPRDKEEEPTRADFAERLDNLLDSIMEHFDDCNSILKCFYPSDDGKSYKSNFQTFRSETRKYRDHIALAVNKIKHRQGRIRFYSVSSLLARSEGYFIEGVDKNGAIGPAPEIHKNGMTAYSIARDFRLHITGVLMLSSSLGDAIRRATQITQAVPDQPTSLAALANVITKVSAIRPIFFSDEIKIEFPAIRVSKDGCHIYYGPRNIENAVVQIGGTASVSYVADGYSRSFRIPYGYTPGALVKA